MGSIEFTTEQRALIEANRSIFAVACPGAGKTQAIVERFVERHAIQDRRRGVALLSFTNVAVDEARSRCSGSPGLMRCPNFVGTIDAFINRFIVGPIYTTRTKRAATFRDSWSSVPGTRISVTGVQGQFELDWFELSFASQAILQPSRMPAELRAGANGMRPDQLAALNRSAFLTWQRLLVRGVIDAATSRLLAATYLADADTYSTLKDILGARFAEVIVDEAQDCSTEDVLVLELLRQAGVRLVLVGDPDQGIYGFRGGSAPELDSLRAELGDGERLNANFRSSPAICAAIDSIRSTDDVDRPVGQHAGVQDPVHVFPFRRTREVVSIATQLLEASGVADQDAVVLAHGAAKARACAGAGAEPGASNNRLVRLANAVSGVRDEDATPANRLRALGQVERILRELGSAGDVELSQADYLERYQLTERTHRYKCLQLAVDAGDPFGGTPKQFRDRLVTLIASQTQLGWLPTALKSPTGNTWPTVSRPVARPLAHSTIHGFKGLQAPAVVLVLPEINGSEDGTRDWCSGVASESRRVIYVGASRAQRLLILAVQENLLQGVTAILERDGVPFLLRASS